MDKSPLMQRSEKLAVAILAYANESMTADEDSLDDIALSLRRACMPGKFYWAFRLALNELEEMQGRRGEVNG